MTWPGLAVCRASRHCAHPARLRTARYDSRSRRWRGGARAQHAPASAALAIFGSPADTPANASRPAASVATVSEAASTLLGWRPGTSWLPLLYSGSIAYEGAPTTQHPDLTVSTFGPETGRSLHVTFWLVVQGGALFADSWAAFVRLIDGMLAALRLMLVLVITALARHLDTTAFVLVLLAACRHHGHCGEPDDHDILPPTHRYPTLWGAAALHA